MAAAASLRSARRNRSRRAKPLTPGIFCAPSWPRPADWSASARERRGAALLTLRTPEAAALAPLFGVLTGALGGAAYWLSAQFWPSNVAVILAMAATDLGTGAVNGNAASAPSAAGRTELWSRLFFLLIKYNALMSLSAANLPFAAPANVAPGLIMVCGYAVSFALQESVTAAGPEKSSAQPSSVHLGLALLIGFAPAALLGIPGLIGLAAAIAASLGLVAFRKFKRGAAAAGIADVSQRLAEVGFYLGALASWRYV